MGKGCGSLTSPAAWSSSHYQGETNIIAERETRPRRMTRGCLAAFEERPLHGATIQRHSKPSPSNRLPGLMPDGIAAGQGFPIKRSC